MIINAKNLSFLSVVIQQTCLVLIIRYSKIRSNNNNNNNNSVDGTASVVVPYLASVVVFSSELYKIIFNSILEIISTIRNNNNRSSSSSSSGITTTLSSRNNNNNNNDDDGQVEEPVPAPTPTQVKVLLTTVVKRLFVDVFTNIESYKLIIPSILYIVQNNLLFFALSNLSVPIYQITNQGKLLTTAIISRIMLKKHITNIQYLSITILALGVALVHISEYYHQQQQQKANTNTTNNNTKEEEEEDDEEGNQLLGLVAVFISCVTSGFAGVYFELILKAKGTKGTTTKTTTTVQQQQYSVYCRNVHLAIYSLILASIHIVYADYNKIMNGGGGMFQGFDTLVIIIVIMQGMTGFVVSMMFKYADAVLKGFATSIAIVVATIASFFLFPKTTTSLKNYMFLIGSIMVIIAVKMYSYYDNTTTTTNNNNDDGKNNNKNNNNNMSKRHNKTNK